jgi:hypothetical protein
MAKQQTSTPHHRMVADIAKRYPDEFLACRDFGHRLVPTDAAFLQSGDIERILKCERCDVKRRQILDKNGYIKSGNYDYAEGYLMPHGTGRLDLHDRAVMRKTNVTRFLNAK